MLWQSVKLITSALIENTPSLISYRYYIENISSILCAGLDFYSMRKTSGTFTENFYSLCRNISSTKSIYAYLFIHYCIPLFINSRVLRKIYDISKGLFMIGFLYFDFSYYSPEFFILKQRMIRQKTKYSMSYIFLGLLIAIKFMELYFSSKKKGNAIVNTIIIDPPYMNSEIGKGICGICKQKWTNPTALTSSGYIFCYTCIRTQIQIFGICPISKNKSSLKNLRKIIL